MRLDRYSLGIGDRFGREGRAQLGALMKAGTLGCSIAPVWNKSFREHSIIGTRPESVRREADAAVSSLSFTGSYYVDADHIGLKNVDFFIDSSDFFTLDIADFVGKESPPDEIESFVDANRRYLGDLKISGIDEPLLVKEEAIRNTAGVYLCAIHEAGKLYRYIEGKKGRGNFVTEVSMDETAKPQSPEELFFILSGLASEGIPAQTIAPKFSGRFNKGVDYVGDVAQFEREFNEDICVIASAVREFGLPENLKLSVHSGSDKFSIYEAIHHAIKRHNVGLHLKTAGTTWLEEVIGLALAGGEGLALVKDLYREALGRYDELSVPYAPVIDIEKGNLPKVERILALGPEEFASMLIHDESCPAYNKDFRQLIHISFRVAAELGERFTSALERHRSIIEENVAKNLFDRHIKPVFLGM
jgi:hypothetical protein